MFWFLMLSAKIIGFKYIKNYKPIHVSQAMGLSLDKILQLLSNEMPGLMPGLEPNKDKVNETLESLSLQRGESYLSMGIGKNILPAIVALHGVDAVGFDIDKDALQYQKEVSARLAFPCIKQKAALMCIISILMTHTQPNM